MKSSIN